LITTIKDFRRYRIFRPAIHDSIANCVHNADIRGPEPVSERVPPSCSPPGLGLILKDVRVFDDVFLTKLQPGAFERPGYLNYSARTIFRACSPDGTSRSIQSMDHAAARHTAGSAIPASAHGAGSASCSPARRSVTANSPALSTAADRRAQAEGLFAPAVRSTLPAAGSAVRLEVSDRHDRRRHKAEVSLSRFIGQHGTA